MTSNKNLVLIGMMGSGKSTVGAQLAHKLKLEFIDTDKEIEKLEKKTIKKIFEISGEHYFRKIEEKVVLEKFKLSKKIIALGGGSFLNNEVRKNSKKKCFVIWLYWDNETLVNRIFKNNKRPIIMNLNKRELHNLINHRNLVYKESNYKLNCESLNKSQIIEKLKLIYENQITKS